MMRGAIVVLALMLAVASAGTTLCEMDCAAGGRADTTVASADAVSSSDVMPCHGGENGTTQHSASLPHGQSRGDTGHSGEHLHARIVATATAKITAVRTITISVANNLQSRLVLPMPAA